LSEATTPVVFFVMARCGRCLTARISAFMRLGPSLGVLGSFVFKASHDLRDDVEKRYRAAF
jgi:hypothetical protein